MKVRNLLVLLAAVVLLALAAVLLLPPPAADHLEFPDDAKTLATGEYLVTAGGCISCHRGIDDETAFSGGLKLETDFGAFHVPNITPDEETGIGGWSAGEFVRAMKHGRGPSGEFHFPAFPDRSYAGLADADALAMAARPLALGAA